MTWRRPQARPDHRTELFDRLLSLAAPGVVDTVKQSVDMNTLAWRLEGTCHGQTVEIEVLAFYLVTVDGFYVLELDQDPEPLVPFLASFDRDPVVEVIATIGTEVVGSWLGYADGEELHRPASRKDKRIENAPGYRRQRRRIDQN